MHNYKKGFTLVELSIVLVIIGLLIGGILAAQSMIGTAKVQALVRQIGQFDVAVTNFKTKFAQLPGDTNLMGASPGSNDGSINSSDGTTAFFDSEIGKFWADLSKSGLSGTDGKAYVDASAGDVRQLGINVPRASLGLKAGVTGFSPGTGMNYYNVGGMADGGSGTDIFTVAAFKPTEVLAVDIKMDNGIANTGNVVASDGTSGLTAGGTDTLAASNCVTTDAGPTYSVAQTTPTCNIVIRMGINTGTLY